MLTASVIQELFAEFVGGWRIDARIAGALAQSHGLADRACSAGCLDSIGSGERFAMFQNLGAGSTGCHLDARGLLAAAVQVRQDIAAGGEVVLSKFGKLERQAAVFATRSPYPLRPGFRS